MAYDPKASTTASGQMAVITPATRAVAADRAAASSSVGSRKRQNSMTSAGRLPGNQYLGFIVGRYLSSVLQQWHVALSGALWRGGDSQRAVRASCCQTLSA